MSCQVFASSLLLRAFSGHPVPPEAVAGEGRRLTSGTSRQQNGFRRLVTTPGSRLLRNAGAGLSGTRGSAGSGRVTTKIQVAETLRMKLLMKCRSGRKEKTSCKILPVCRKAVLLHRFWEKQGRLAQLVQSVCLTSRGSGVRIPQRPRGTSRQTTFSRKQDLRTGRLAQLVQSVCLTSRGSGVRIPQRPPASSKVILSTRALSSAGSERLPYKQRVGGSNPSAPTFKRTTSFARCMAKGNAFHLKTFHTALSILPDSFWRTAAGSLPESGRFMPTGWGRINIFH